MAMIRKPATGAPAPGAAALPPGPRSADPGDLADPDLLAEPAAPAPVPPSAPVQPTAPAVSGGTAAGTPGEHRTSLVNLRETAAYASTLFGLACLIKVYGVSRYATSTTVALITTAPEQVILGTLAVYVYPTMAVLAYGTPYVAALWRRTLPREAWPFVVAVTTLTALMTPLDYHLVSLAVLGASLLVELALRRLSERRPGGPSAAVRRALGDRVFVLLGVLALLVGFLITLDSPWAAAEVIVVTEPVAVSSQNPAGGSDGPVELASSARPFVGYVIDSDLTGYTVLNASTRYVMMLDRSQVAARYTCHSHEEQVQGRRPLLDRLLGRPYRSPNTDCDALAAALATSAGR